MDARPSIAPLYRARAYPKLRTALDLSYRGRLEAHPEGGLVLGTCSGKESVINMKNT